MDIKRLIASGGACYFISVASIAHELNDTTEKKLFQNYALAMCLASEYKDTSIYSDAGRALNGYREFGKLDLAVYHDVYSLLKMWNTKPYLSKSGSTMKVARCIDFHNSQDVESLFLKNDPCQDSKNWRDKNQYIVRCPSKL